MKVNKSIKSKMGDLQETFSFFRSVMRLASVRAEAVLSFSRVNGTGKDSDVAYTTWLRWSAPLSPSAYSVN